MWLQAKLKPTTFKAIHLTFRSESKKSIQKNESNCVEICTNHIFCLKRYLNFNENQCRNGDTPSS